MRYVMKIYFRMRKCYVCDSKKGTFQFPRDKRRQKWIKLLGLSTSPGPLAGICCLHFSPCDFYYDGHKMCLKDNAYPLAQVKVSYFCASSDNL